MSGLLTNEAISVLKSGIKSGIDYTGNNKHMQLTPSIFFKYYDSNTNEFYICKLSLTVTSHTDKIIFSIDLSLHPDIIPDKYIGVKHSIDKIDKTVNKSINNILSNELSKNNFIPLKMNLKCSGVKPDVKINSMYYDNEHIACISYYDSITIKKLP